MLPGLSADEMRDLIVSVGTHRAERRLSPVEVAELLEKACQAGASRNECAEAVGVGTTQIGTFLQLLELPEKVRHLADWGSTGERGIAFSALAKLSRLDQSEQGKAAEAVLRDNLSWQEVVELVQLSDRTGDSLERCVEKVIDRRTEVETRHVFLGAITEPLLKTKIRKLRQPRRDSLFAEILEQIVKSNRLQASRLGRSHFSIVTSDQLVENDSQAEELEQAINAALASKLLS